MVVVGTREKENGDKVVTGIGLSVVAGFHAKHTNASNIIIVPKLVTLSGRAPVKLLCSCSTKHENSIQQFDTFQPWLSERCQGGVSPGIVWGSH